MPTGMTRMARVASVAIVLVLLGVTSVLGQDASPPASPVSPTPGAESWGQVPFEAGLRDPYGASRITAVAAGPRGIVAVGTSPTGAAAWHSVDGLSWQRAIPPRSWTSTGQFDRYPSLEDVVATDEGFVVVGTERDGPRRNYGNVGSVWASEDGLIWRRSARGVGPYLRHVIEHDGRLYALGGRVADRIAAAVWASDDGTEWEQVFTAPDDGDIEVIVSDGQTIVAGSVEGMAWSTDGRTWEEAPIEQAGRFDIWLEEATAYAGGFLAVGSRDGDGAAWHSRDGRSWEAVPETVDTGAYITHLNGVAALPDGGVLVTAGTDRYEGYLYRWDDDGGWGEPIVSVPGTDLGGEWPFAAVATDGDVALVVGQQPDGPRRFSPAVWTTPPPLAQGRPGQAAMACPGPRPTIKELVVMDPAARLDCFGDTRLAFRAWLAPHEPGDLEFYRLPHWLTAGKGGMRALPVDGDYATMSLVLHLRPRDQRRLDIPVGRWAMVTGHFDDPAAARKCGADDLEGCRQAFVVTDVRAVSGR